MKKRIICLILVIASLTLSLASCGGFTFWEDDLSQYVEFNKNKFDDYLKSGKIEIDDGTFSDDNDKRVEKVEDSIYAAIAGGTDKTDKKTEGKPGAHDLLYYAYFITATVGGREIVFSGDTMVKDKAEETQFGIHYPSELEGKIIDLYKDYEFKADELYAPKTSGNALEGQLAFVTYTRKYTTVGGEEKVITETATKHPILLEKGNLFAEKLFGQSVGSKLTAAIKVEVADKNSADYKKYAGEYSDVTINWVADAKAHYEHFDEITYDETKMVTPTLTVSGESKTVDVKNIELKYYVFPAYYVNVEEFTAEAVINTIYTSNITYANVAKILVGPDFAEMTAEEKEEAVKKYKFSVDNDENVTLEEMVTILSTAQKAITDKKKTNDTNKSTLDSKETAYESAYKAREDAKKVVDEAGEAATDAQKKALAEKETAYNTALKAYQNAKKTYEGEDGKGGSKAELEKAIADRDAKVEEFFKKVTKDAVLNGYKENIVFDNLLTAYNTEIKENLAKVLFDLMTSDTYITYKGRPQSAVDEAVDYLIQNYQYCFYNNLPLNDTEKADEDNTFYKKYQGSFDTFLIQYAVPNDLGVKANNYDEAMSAIGAEAAEHVDTMLAIYAVAKAYGKTVTDEVYDAYLESDDYDITKEYYNGVEAARFAYQFDQVIDFILTSKESDDGKHVTYERVVFKTKAVENNDAEVEEDHDHADHNH